MLSRSISASLTIPVFCTNISNHFYHHHHHHSNNPHTAESHILKSSALHLYLSSSTSWIIDASWGPAVFISGQSVFCTVFTISPWLSLWSPTDWGTTSSLQPSLLHHTLSTRHADLVTQSNPPELTKDHWRESWGWIISQFTPTNSTFPDNDFQRFLRHPSLSSLAP